MAYIAVPCRPHLQTNSFFVLVEHLKFPAAYITVQNEKKCFFPYTRERYVSITLKTISNALLYLVYFNKCTDVPNHIFQMYTILMTNLSNNVIFNIHDSVEDEYR